MYIMKISKILLQMIYFYKMKRLVFWGVICYVDSNKEIKGVVQTHQMQDFMYLLVVVSFFCVALLSADASGFVEVIRI